MDRTTRPVFLNPLLIRMPVGALTSIGHRVSGIVLSVSLPFWLHLLGLSLRDERGFTQVDVLVTHWAVKTGLVLVVWALAHHVLAGIRHLLSDVDVGSTLHFARRTAYAVNLCGVAVALIAAVAVW
jgi:succinate dehydrogenase / fumarate reductase cytochrome b subunit